MYREMKNLFCDLSDYFFTLLGNRCAKQLREFCISFFSRSRCVTLLARIKESRVRFEQQQRAKKIPGRVLAPGIVNCFFLL